MGERFLKTITCGVVSCLFALLVCSKLYYSDSGVSMDTIMCPRGEFNLFLRFLHVFGGSLESHILIIMSEFVLDLNT